MPGSEPWVLRRCRETSQKEAMVWAGFAFAALLPVMFAWSDARSVLLGPVRADAAYFDAALPRGVVEVEAASATDTGIAKGRVFHSPLGNLPVHDENRRSYFLVPMGERPLVVEAKEAPRGLVTGRLEDLPPEVDGQLGDTAHLPVLLRTDSPRRYGWLVVTLSALGLAGVSIGLNRQLRRAADPRRHPAAARVANWGDLASLSEEIQDDIEGAEVRRGARTFGERFFVVDGWGEFEVRRWEDLLWVYVLRVQKRVHGIPAGSAWSAVVHFREGKCEFAGFEEEARRFAETAASRAPWAVHGWSEKDAEDFTNRPGLFRQAVRKRREQHEGRAGLPERANVPRPARPGGKKPPPRRPR